MGCTPVAELTPDCSNHVIISATSRAENGSRSAQWPVGGANAWAAQRVKRRAGRNPDRLRS